MADRRCDGRLEGFRCVDAGKVSVVEADAMRRLELPDQLHHLGLVLEAVDDQRLEEDRVGLVGLVLAAVAADSDAVPVVQPDADRLVEASHREARDDEH